MLGSLAKPVVAHFVERYLPLTETWIYSQISNMQRYKPVVFTNGVVNFQHFPFKDVFVHDEIALRPLSQIERLAKRRIPIYPPLYSDAISYKSPKVLHAHFGDEGFKLLGIRAQLNVPLVTSFYGYDVSKLPRLWKWRMRLFLLFSVGDLFLVEGSYMKRALVRLGCPEHKVHVHHLGISFAENIRESRSSLLENNRVTVLIVASFREKKGLPYALEAFALLCRQYPASRLVVIGDANSSVPAEMTIKLRILQLVKDYQIEEKVTFMGYQPHSVFLAHLRKADIYLQPSIIASDGDTEGGAPVSIIEASAYGLPIVSTRHCDIPEVVLEGNTGILVAERDVIGLANALCYLAQNPATREDMGLKGQKHMLAEYDFAKQSVKIEEIYDSMLQYRKGK